MKLKTLAAMAIMTLVAASYSYAAPAFQLVDDMSGTTQTPSTGIDNTNVGSVPGLNNTDLNSASAGSADNSLMPSDGTAANPANPAGSNDDISADTATGDDDY